MNSILMNYRHLILIVSIVALEVSCNKAENFSPSSTAIKESDDINDVKVKANNLTLFADVSEYTIGENDETKASEDYEMIELESLLDRSRAEAFTYPNGDRVQQVPFKINEKNTFAFNGSTTKKIVPTDSLSIIKKFLITTDWVNGSHTVRVATMICSPQYMLSMTENNSNGVSFLHKSNFTGTVFLSKPDGTFVNAYLFFKGRIIGAKLIRPNESISKKYTITKLYTLKESSATKSLTDEIHELDECLCVAYREFTDGGLNFGGEGDKGGGNKDETEEQDDRDEGGCGYGGLVSAHVVLSVNDENLGEVRGEGNYEYGSDVNIGAKPKYIKSKGRNAYFCMWVGDLWDHRNEQDFIISNISEDITSTACFSKFEAKSTCIDRDKGIQNPLDDMLITPTSKNKGAVTGTFKAYRHYKREHTGVDLYAEPGTPFRSMFSGEIVRIIDCQPNRVKNSNGDYVYPDGYKGDVDGAGNRITVESVISGKKIRVSYWHLDADNPVAFDIELGKKYDTRDNRYVEQGDILGFTGSTGNAISVDFQHLHLGIQEWRNGTWEWVDPAPYLNGSIPSFVINGADGINAREYRKGEMISLIDIKCQ